MLLPFLISLLESCSQIYTVIILFPGTVDFTMFTDVLQVLEVYNGTNGLLGGGSHLGPWLYIDSSTVDPQTSRKISTAISRCHLKENKG